jgi:DNA-directed RNA polymerase specialized sigma subunit
MNETLFTQYRPMIEQAVWNTYKYNKRMEKDDLQSEAFLIFCETIKKYDSSKAKFSTYLYSNLRKLKIYTRTEMTKKYKTETIEQAYNKHFNSFIDKRNEIESIISKEELSSDAKEILAVLLSWNWNIPGVNKKPRFTDIKETFSNLHWKRCRIYKAWEEIRIWWNSKGFIDCY